MEGQISQDEANLKKERNHALRQRSKWDNRFYLLDSRYQALYGDKAVAQGLERIVAKRTPQKKNKKPSKVIEKKQKASSPPPHFKCPGNPITQSACASSDKAKTKVTWNGSGYSLCNSCRKAVASHNKQEKKKKQSE